MDKFYWPHKDLLDVDDLSVDEIDYLLNTAEQFQEVNTRPIKKVPTLRGKSVVMFFSENSTRTRVSFDIAGKRLSADTFALSKSGSSVQKGESLKDTALTLQAMNPDIIVIRHSASGAARFIAARLSCSVVNAGDGWHAHPTQALLDSYTLRKYWRDNNLGGFAGKTVVIIGDILHSRVARSNIKLLHALGANIRIFAPKTLLPIDVHNWPVEIFSSPQAAIQGADAIMCLRLQLERQSAGLLPDLSEYARCFCITSKMLSLAAENAVILHPGPINRGLEIASDLADSDESRILDQVNAGVAVRMAILFTLGTRNDGYLTSEGANNA